MIRTLIFQKGYFICFNENPLKMMKDAFYFVLKAPFVPKIFNFFLVFSCHIEKRLHPKDVIKFQISDITIW